MDLFAYGQIEKLMELATYNNISVPRLRGYRLMTDEQPLTEEEIQDLIQRYSLAEAEMLCRGNWRDHRGHTYSHSMDRLIQKYFVTEKETVESISGGNMSHTWTHINVVGIRWDRIHGKKRKNLKYKLKQVERDVRAQYALWNQYAGQQDVLYIHSRMGGYNWRYYPEKESITSQPWFLARVDDAWDHTYCDFYARVKFPEDAP